jgi:hypothetical protein
MSSYLIINVVFSAFVVVGVVGLLVWSIATQHRDHGCAQIRIRTAPRGHVPAGRQARQLAGLTNQASSSGVRS